MSERIERTHAASCLTGRRAPLRMPRRAHLLALAALLLAGCFGDRAERQPVAVTWDRDRDEYSGMAISDRRFAAQAIEPGGKAHKFDDMGCLVTWLERQPWRGEARLWVRDRMADRWIDAERAHWRPGEPTPSGYGFGASLEPGYGALSLADVRLNVLSRRPGAPPSSALPPGTSRPPESVRP